MVRRTSYGSLFLASLEMDLTLAVLIVVSLLTFLCLVLSMLAADRINNASKGNASEMITGLTASASIILGTLVLLVVGLFIFASKEHKMKGTPFSQSYPLGLTANASLVLVFALMIIILTQVTKAKSNLNSGNTFDAHDAMTNAAIVSGVSFAVSIMALALYLKRNCGPLDAVLPDTPEGRLMQELQAGTSASQRQLELLKQLQQAAKRHEVTASEVSKRAQEIMASSTVQGGTTVFSGGKATAQGGIGMPAEVQQPRPPTHVGPPKDAETAQVLRDWDALFPRDGKSTPPVSVTTKPSTRRQQLKKWWKQQEARAHRSRGAAPSRGHGGGSGRGGPPNIPGEGPSERLLGAWSREAVDDHALSAD